ncbi:MAG: Hsp20/alpha crystallin family protein [Rubellimicrobium sp.]|nr:Hsp20/alpha crystallin family protein [Rubellimicrobium sp.]
MVEKTQTPGLWPNLFDPLRNFGLRLAEFLSPAADAAVADDAYRITLEVPGVAENDIAVTAQGGSLVIKGEKKSEREEKTEDYYFSERQYGSFSRSFRLPADADEDAVSATLKDGVLTVTIPRRAEAALATKKVRITTG